MPSAILPPHPATTTGWNGTAYSQLGFLSSWCLPVAHPSRYPSLRVVTARPHTPRFLCCQKAVGGDGGDGGTRIPYSRLAEFAHTEGDHALQNDIATDLTWRIAQASSEESIDRKIKQFDENISEKLSDMFGRHERDIIERNEDLALRASLEDLARWNSSWREGQRTSRARREQISAELAIVNRLLLSQQRSKKRRGSQSRLMAVPSKTRVRRPSRQTGNGYSSTAQDVDTALFGPLTGMQAASVIAIMTAGCIRGLDGFVKAHDAQTLSRLGMVSLTFVLLAAHVSGLHQASKDANKTPRP